MKKIQDYLHFYLGCEVDSSKTTRLVGFIYRDDETWPVVQDFKKDGARIGIPYSLGYGMTKPILRPLSSMTEEEMCCASDIVMPEGIGKLKLDDLSFKVDFAKREIINYGNAIAPGGWLSLFPYLLSRHFDLFNLIPENLAIDSTILTHQSP